MAYLANLAASVTSGLETLSLYPGSHESPAGHVDGHTSGKPNGNNCDREAMHAAVCKTSAPSRPPPSCTTMLSMGVVGFSPAMAGVRTYVAATLGRKLVHPGVAVLPWLVKNHTHTYYCIYISTYKHTTLQATQQRQNQTDKFAMRSDT